MLKWLFGGKKESLEEMKARVSADIDQEINQLRLKGKTRKQIADVLMDEGRKTNLFLARLHHSPERRKFTEAQLTELKMRAEIIGTLPMRFWLESRDRVEEAKKVAEEGYPERAVEMINEVIKHGYAEDGTYAVLSDIFVFMGEWGKALKAIQTAIEVCTTKQDRERYYKRLQAIRSKGGGNA